MSAPIILSHQLAASILFFYAFLAICFSKRSQRQPPKRPPQPVRLTHLDVDLEYCTKEELEYLTVLLLTQAQTVTLTQRETSRFAEVCRELHRR
jgi:hypothetical protein